jgi:hypothetical protein
MQESGADYVGAGLLAKAVYQSILMSNDTPLSRASRIAAPPLPQGSAQSCDVALSSPMMAIQFQLSSPR